MRVNTGGTEGRRPPAISASFHGDCESPCINDEYGGETLMTNFCTYNREGMSHSQFLKFIKYMVDDI
jgi:hypothetical protein